MTNEFYILLFEQKFLIIKNSEGKPFVYAICFVEAIAENTCEILNNKTERTEQNK